MYTSEGEVEKILLKVTWEHGQGYILTACDYILVYFKWHRNHNENPVRVSRTWISKIFNTKF